MRTASLRSLAVLAFLTLATEAFSQTRDTRAALKVEGAIKEVSVSPKGRVWLTSAVGKTYYADDLRAGWHYGPTFGETDESSKPSLDRITFFNGDTAIMTGFIGTSKEGRANDGLYRTTDGGAHWSLLNFGGDQWIYDAFADSKGRAWIGGSSGAMLYSSDFGTTWSKLASPYGPSTRMHTIHMNADGRTGIAGALENGLYLTRDNWKSAIKVPTPLDKKKYSNVSDLPDNRIEKAQFWKQWIVVDQNGRIFYSDTGHIAWQKFPFSVVGFTLDNSDGGLFAISAGWEILKFSSPTGYKVFSKGKLRSRPSSLASVSGALFVLDSRDEVTRIDRSGMFHDGLYTKDQPIAQPEIQATTKSGRLVWGLDYDQLYISEDRGQTWFREKVLPESFVDMDLQDDSTAVLWDGSRSNYRYSLKTHTLSQYMPPHPLAGFLSSPVRSMEISAGSRGCFHQYEDIAIFKARSNGSFRASKIKREEKQSLIPVSNPAASNGRLRKILQTIDGNPVAMPQMSDFRISADDISSYRKMLRKALNGEDASYDLQESTVNPSFMKSFPDHLDTVSDATLHRLIKQTSGIWSTTVNWLDVTLINENTDTLYIRNRYCETNSPLNLPWDFSFKGRHFSCYDLEFSRFVLDAMPRKFNGCATFDNKYLIMALALYLQPSLD